MTTNDGGPASARYAALLSFLAARERGSHGWLRDWEKQYEAHGPHWLAGLYSSLLSDVLGLCPPPLLRAVIEATDAAMLRAREGGR